MISRNAVRVAILTALALLAIPPAQALPRFAQKERKSCATCHIRPTGGGKRNAAGQWYEHHGFSFTGYVWPKPAKKATKAKPAAKAPKPAATKKAKGRK